MSKENLNRYREEEKEETNINENLENETTAETSSDQDSELVKVTNSYLRVLADFENYKKRINEEIVRERKYANQGLLEELVNVIDIFDKAVNMETDDDKIKNFLYGFIMINTSFKQILESHGVKKIIAKGELFDPRYHHAMETVWDETKEENIIIDEMQTGYTYKDRLLRPSLVKVNKKMKGNENNE